MELFCNKLPPRLVTMFTQAIHHILTQCSLFTFTANHCCFKIFWSFRFLLQYCRLPIFPSKQVGLVARQGETLSYILQKLELSLSLLTSLEESNIIRHNKFVTVLTTITSNLLLIMIYLARSHSGKLPSSRSWPCQRLHLNMVLKKKMKTTLI